MKARLAKLSLLLLLLLPLAGCEQEPAGPQLTGGAEATLPAFQFPDLEGEIRQSSDWQGKVLVVNYWATWCPPCRKEMPLFVETQKRLQERGLQFVGIAIDDPHLVQDFVDVYNINFPILIGNAEAVRLSTRMGNRFESLPFTAIFDREGNTRYIQAGEVTAEVLERELEPLL